MSYTFTLDAEGLTPKARKDGSIAFFGELPNTPVLVIPAPVHDGREEVGVVAVRVRVQRSCHAEAVPCG
ncbi:hypothetical protein GCM10019016_066730 [Streptomyces prasinosporus]|uniref:Uncharacterized protein n=1 Tax=Streptomyces prasinosporus TaxID=68256 RepID=A0ABP6TXZ1_9ACTN